MTPTTIVPLIHAGPLANELAAALPSMWFRANNGDIVGPQWHRCVLPPNDHYSFETLAVCMRVAFVLQDPVHEAALFAAVAIRDWRTIRELLGIVFADDGALCFVDTVREIIAEVDPTASFRAGASVDQATSADALDSAGADDATTACTECRSTESPAQAKAGRNVGTNS